MATVPEAPPEREEELQHQCSREETNAGEVGGVDRSGGQRSTAEQRVASEGDQGSEGQCRGQKGSEPVHSITLTQGPGNGPARQSGAALEGRVSQREMAVCPCERVQEGTEALTTQRLEGEVQ